MSLERCDFDPSLSQNLTFRDRCCGFLRARCVIPDFRLERSQGRECLERQMRIFAPRTVLALFFHQRVPAQTHFQPADLTAEQHRPQRLQRSASVDIARTSSRANSPVLGWVRLQPQALEWQRRSRHGLRVDDVNLEFSAVGVAQFHTAVYAFGRYRKNGSRRSGIITFERLGCMSITEPSKPRVVLRPIRSRFDGLLHSAERLEAVRAWLRAPRATAQLERVVRWATLTAQGDAALCCVVSKGNLRIVATYNLALGQFKFENFAQTESLLPESTLKIEDPPTLERLTSALGLHFVPLSMRVVPMRFHGYVIGAICVFERRASQMLAPGALQLLSELALEAADSAYLAPVTVPNPAETDNRQAVATLGQQLPVLLFNLDTGGRFAHVEGRALELLEIEATQLLGRSAFEVWRDPRQPEFLATLRHTLVSANSAVSNGLFTWREQRFNTWMTPCGPGLTGLALMLESTDAAVKRTSSTELALVMLPNLPVALEFVNGVGGLRHFTFEMQRDHAWQGERLVLSGRGVKIVVDRGSLNDLELSTARA